MTTTAQHQQPRREQTDTAPYHPAPGTEFPFSISDIAHATAHLLGEDWNAESRPWGISGALSGPFLTPFDLLVNKEDELVIEYTTRYAYDALPAKPDLPQETYACDGGVYLRLAHPAHGLEELAQRAAAAIRAVTGS
ncbi:hypothetical protein AB0B04_18860 [Streptomyces xinghaiensis]|uniref:Uncharacterized protein n=2 Tax=Streptomyces TaxID=1883 RepID=A0A3M8EX31_9ACTN|nr:MULTISPECIES: hypothetical protein [Streptomyces]KNE81387.1 hypothetical protein ADZ36_16535 [Streptomyces fradiae]OFA48274.1 hypothetical protein BEN35_19230 [Streptomyces fradiae]PQM20657.1 hypothetical protein Sfr7A_26085 [Streptomyces xinghaiensis]RKM92597.1 hypothetical protein SFRA_024740 [Streptomyces xinghaiensis]RNC70565.1 hypothetical protein DC095_025730 [Streptomyces xinghaiensis]